MAFTLADHWVWDLWVADDGDRFHLYYLHAPQSLGDPELRHRNARVGHAVSDDLCEWTDLGVCLTPSGGAAVDSDATWTGSIVPGPDGTWRLFYTGSRFLAHDSVANIETVALATSTDLHTWVKHPELALSADPALYETFGTSSWREEAWRDPWVMPALDGTGWWMLLTARASDGEHELDRGVVGLAVSADLQSWRPAPALSAPGAGFSHLEVPQVIEIDGHRVLLFSCDTPALAGDRVERGERGGIWWVEMGSATAGSTELIDASAAALLVDDSLYAGRAVQDRDGSWVLLAFRNMSESGEFIGGITDPMPLSWNESDGLRLGVVSEARR